MSTSDYKSSAISAQVNSTQNYISGQSHSFDTGIAHNLGLEEAVVFNHVHYWISVNSKKKNNFRDGKTWVYETPLQMLDYMPYLTQDRIRRALDNLVKHNILVRKYYNKSKMDRTSWYSLSDSINSYDLAILPDGLAKLPNASCENARCIDTSDNTSSKSLAAAKGGVLQNLKGGTSEIAAANSRCEKEEDLRNGFIKRDLAISDETLRSLIEIHGIDYIYNTVSRCHQVKKIFKKEKILNKAGFIIDAIRSDYFGLKT